MKNLQHSGLQHSGLLAIILSLVFLIFLGVPAYAQDNFDLEDADAEEQTGKRRPKYDAMHWSLESLIKELPARELVTLKLDAKTDFLALEIPALAPQAKGHLLMLPGLGQHPDWPEGLAPLRRVMPEYGWSSLAISVPNFNFNSVPERTLSTEPLLDYSAYKKPNAASANQEESSASADFGAEDTADEETSQDTPEQDLNSLVAAYHQQIEARLQAAQQYLGTNSKQIQVLALQGESVYWLASWIKNGGLKKQQPLILLFVEEAVGVEAEALNNLLVELGSHPILDIYAKNNSLQTSLAKERKQAYLRAGNKQALQLELKMPASGSDATANRWLTQRVEGWLRKL